MTLSEAFLIGTTKTLSNGSVSLTPVRPRCPRHRFCTSVRHGLPKQDMVAKRSELGTLRHQLNLKRPSMPIRTLISEMPGTFTKLAPCVLMSPLSVAQYLPAGQAAFDVVIFDEASQITTWDAIGAIARGKQAIIVGDPQTAAANQTSSAVRTAGKKICPKASATSPPSSTR